MRRLIRGALAGCAATAPMSALMLLLHRWPRPEREPLPPRQITEEFAERADVRKRLDKSQERLAVVAAHFGYGATAGMLYAPLSPKMPGHPAVKGAAFGLLVWTLSYLGWLPAAGILPPATEHGARRNGLMIAAHLVWGATLGMMAERIGGDNS